MTSVFSFPKFVLSGEDALKIGVSYFKDMGTKALIVTDENIVKLGHLKKLTDMLNSENISYHIYDEINSEPTNLMIDKGIKIYKENSCDFLIGIGGGSPVDAMKAIGIMDSNAGNICDYMGKPILKPLPPMCAIPTTSGTGSEATKFSIITNLNSNVKMLLNDPKLLVDLTILESEFNATVSSSVIAATGIDALTHAVEAYTSVKANSMSDIYAVSAVSKIFKNLHNTYTGNGTKEARSEMALAAFYGGVAINNASVSIVHGMSRPIGALFHVPHGMSNAMLFKVCLEFLKPAALTRLCDFAKVIGIYEAGMREEDGATAFVSATIDLLRTMKIDKLSDYGVSKEDFFKFIPKMAEDAMISGSPLNTRRTPTKEDLMNLYEKLWYEGE